MKSAKGLVLVAILVFLGAGSAYPVSADYGDWQEKMEKKRERIFKELNLTAEQTEKLAQNRKEQTQRLKALHDALKEKRAELKKILQDPQVVREKVTPIANDIKSLQSQLIDLRIEGIFKVKEILTPEQFSRFQELTAKHQQKMFKRHNALRERKRYPKD